MFSFALFISFSVLIVWFLFFVNTSGVCLSSLCVRFSPSLSLSLSLSFCVSISLLCVVSLSRMFVDWVCLISVCVCVDCVCLLTAVCVCVSSLCVCVSCLSLCVHVVSGLLVCSRQVVWVVV